MVDSASLLNIQNATQSNNERHILVLADEGWGITCDQLGDVIQLQQEDVKWSGLNADSLLLGTIKQSLAMLLDPNNILKKLQFQEHLVTS